MYFDIYIFRLPHLYGGYSLTETRPYSNHQEDIRQLQDLSHQTQAQRFSQYPSSGMRPATGHPLVQPICIQPESPMPVSHNPFKNVIHSASLRGLPGCPPGTHGKKMQILMSHHANSTLEIDLFNKHHPMANDT